MKRIVWLLAALLAVPCYAGDEAMQTEIKTPASFEPLKALVGEWREVGKEEKGAVVHYELLAAGTALVESMNPGTPHSMATVYYPDGENVMMTHFCSEGNQPRMLGTGDAKSMTFKLVDITNLASPGAGRMVGLVFTFTDKDHLTAAWTHKAGEKSEIYTFTMERKKKV